MGREAVVHGVDFAFQPLDLASDDAEGASISPGVATSAPGRTGRSGFRAAGRELGLTQRGDGDADRGIGFVDLADRGHAPRSTWLTRLPSTSPALPPSPVRV